MARPVEDPQPTRSRGARVEHESCRASEPDNGDCLVGVVVTDADGPDELVESAAGMDREDVTGACDLFDVAEHLVGAGWLRDGADRGRKHHLDEHEHGNHADEA